MIWDATSYAFVQDDAPASVNPSLWRQEQLNNIHGLFEVTPGIYPLRGFDLSNMTLIDSDSGWIVVDPLTARETTAAPMAFSRKQLGDKAVTAIIFIHSHVDHFGGVLGVIEGGNSATDWVPVIAPEGFMEEATSENIIVGNTMGRHSAYMYGKNLARTPRGHIGSGLGKGPDFGAEVVSRTMHNLYTLRGAKVRNALKWSGHIDQVVATFGTADVYFGSHHWPLWGNAKIIDFLEKQRDTYKYIHDQTLRLAAQGLTPREIAEQLTMPEALPRSFSSRGYYGTTKHNAKAVYQQYFGWCDGNPVNFDPLPPVDAAERHIKLMGAERIVLASAKDLLEQTPMENFFDTMAVMLNGADAEGEEMKINISFTDLDETRVLSLKKPVLNHMVVEGSKLDALRSFALLETPNGRFNIVTP
ncbi:MAG: alkyl sulfatase BDS1-like metallo-beta-lactamase superfamily hydrolase [Halieaceae bacterium]